MTKDDEKIKGPKIEDLDDEDSSSSKKPKPDKPDKPEKEKKIKKVVHGIEFCIYCGSVLKEKDNKYKEVGKKIVYNRAKCKICGGVIECKYRNELVFCNCRSLSITGGEDFLGRNGKKEDYLELSVIEDL